MSMQIEPVAEAVVTDVEEQVRTTVEQPLVVDKALVARLVGETRRQGLSVDGS